MANAEFSLAVRIDPTRARTWVSLADTYFVVGLFEECLQSIEMIEDSQAADWLDYFYRGTCRAGLGQHEEGIADLTTFVEKVPDDPMGWFNRGNVYRNLGNLEDSLSDYTHSIYLNPNHPPAYINRGMSYEDMGEVELALSDFSTALSFGEIPYAYRGRAGIYQKMGKYEEAIRDYERAIELYPYEAGMHGYLAETYLFANRYQDAVDSATTALSLGAGSDEPLIMQRRGRAYIGLGLYEEAIADLNTSIEMYRAFDSFYYRGVAYHENGQTQLAIADLQLFLDNLRPGVEAEAEDARRRLSELGQ